MESNLALPTREEIERAQRLLCYLDSSLTEDLTQDHQMLAELVPADADLVKALHLLEREHPAYALVYAARQRVARARGLEETSDQTRHRGLDGLWAQCGRSLKGVVRFALRTVDRAAA